LQWRIHGKKQYDFQARLIEQLKALKGGRGAINKTISDLEIGATVNRSNKSLGEGKERERTMASLKTTQTSLENGNA